MVLVLLAGCPRPTTSSPPEPRPPEAPVVGEPTLEIDAPARGTFVDDGSVIVRGRVRDEGPVRVAINGTPATVAGDGSFMAVVQVPRGLAILETHALDADNHDVRDVRAVLAGPFAPSDGSVAAPIGARLGRAGVMAIGKALAASAKALDLTQAAQALNPIYEDPGCLGARVDIANVTVGTIEVALVPATNALELAVRIDGIEVKLDVHYRAACIGGSTSMSVRTRARVTSELRVRAGGRIQTSFPKPDVTLDDFQFQMTGMPGVIESMLKRVTRPAVEIALAQMISSKLPPLVDAQLSALLTRPALPQVLGRDVDVIVAPSWVELAPTGIAMVADAKLAVRGGAAGRYATTRAFVPVPAGDAAVWVSANSVNQLFAGLWASRAFDRTLPRDQLGPLAMLLDPRIATLELSIALPPTIHADTALELVVGDLLITARDAAGAEVQRFAVSLRTGLAIKPGVLALGTTEPQVFAQLLAQHGPLSRPLDPAGVEGIVKGAWSLVATSIDEALAQIPIPGVAKGAQLASLGARDGAIVLELKLN